jgi:hypothetical protein
MWLRLNGYGLKFFFIVVNMEFEYFTIFFNSIFTDDDYDDQIFFRKRPQF